MKKLLMVPLTIIMSLLFSVAVFAEPLATLNVDKGDVSIVGFTTTENDGKDYFVALLEYTNKSDESDSPWLNISVNAFQDGVELESGYIYDFSYENYKSDDTKVRPGGTLKFFKIYELAGDSPVDVEVSSMFDFTDNQHIEYTFDLGNQPENTAKEDKDWEAEYNAL